MSEKNPFGQLFRLWAWICLIGFGIADFSICFSILDKLVGSWFSTICFIFFPVVFAFAPWYALIAWKEWIPLAVVYGGGILTCMLYYISSILLKEEYYNHYDIY